MVKRYKNKPKISFQLSFYTEESNRSYTSAYNTAIYGITHRAVHKTSF